VTQLYANQAIEIDELRRDQAVSAALAEQGGLPLAQRLLRAAAWAGADRLWRDVQGFHPFSRAWLKALEEDGFVIHRAPAPRGEPLPWLPLASGVGGRRAGI
jgi:deoxyribodipyrimidine photo-lyase